jgi:hypothetical protein
LGGRRCKRPIAYKPRALAETDAYLLKQRILSAERAIGRRWRELVFLEDQAERGELLQASVTLSELTRKL